MIKTQRTHEFNLVRNKYTSFMMAKIEDFTKFDTPMALFDWLLREWRRPIRGLALEQAYQAVWAISIDKGVVEL